MEKPQQHLNFIISTTERVLSNYDKSKVEEIQFFYLGLYERLHAAAKSLSLLIGNIDVDPSVEFSAGLILRTLILDFLIGLRGLDLTQQAEGAGEANIKDSVMNYCNSVLSDGIVHTFKNLINLKEAQKMTEVQLQNSFRNMSVKYVKFVDPYNEDGVAPKSKFPTPQNVTNLFKQLAGSPEPIKNAALNYELYLFYSKYEHFNILSYDLMRRLDDDQRKTLSSSIDLLVLHLANCLTMLLRFSPDAFLEQAYHDVENYMKEYV